jgi:predicted acetyltransferase
MHRGKWEIMCHPKNTTSIYFWDKVINEYTNGKFEHIESCKEVAYQEGTYADFFFFEN